MKWKSGDISVAVQANIPKFSMLDNIGSLRDLVPLVQFKNREKHPWRSVNFSKVAGFSLQLY